MNTARLVNIARVNVGPGWHCGPELHEDYHQWLMVVKGRSFVRIGGREYEASAGQCLFFQQNHTHEEWTDPRDPHESWGVCFAWEDCPDDMPVCVADTQGRLRVLGQWLTEEWKRHEPESASLRQHYFVGMLTEWVRLAADRRHPLVTKIRDYIRAHVGDALGLDDLAAVAGLSRFHFSRLYHELAGRPLSDDLRALRLEHAQGLLMSTDIAIKDIARLSGLTDQHYLTRLFRQHLNVTPGELRRTRPVDAMRRRYT
jgi:AraC-like DNA-binding protein